MKPARRNASSDDVQDASDLVVAELIEGDLFTSPRPAIPSEPAFTMVPDWACEVLSPTTAALDRARRTSSRPARE